MSRSKSTPADELWTVEESCQYLGISRSTFYRRPETRSLRYSKPFGPEGPRRYYAADVRMLAHLNTVTPESQVA
jgi:excisionase family DNA binding protein